MDLQVRRANLSGTLAMILLATCIFLFFSGAQVLAGIIGFFGMLCVGFAYSFYTWGWLAQKSFNLERRFLMRWYDIDVGYRVLIVGGFPIFGFAFISLIKRPEFFTIPASTAPTVLQTNVQILTTVFAITISLTLLGLEYFSQDLTPRITGSLFSSKFIQFLIGSYIVGIMSSLFSFSFLTRSSQVLAAKISFIILAWCGLYLIAYLFFMLHRIQPRAQLRMVEESIPSDYRKEILSKARAGKAGRTDPDEIFVDLQKIIISTIKKGDLTLFRDWISLLFRAERDYLALEKQEAEEPLLMSSQEVREISAYFFQLQANIYQQILITDNERFLPTYINEIEEILEVMIELRTAGSTEPVFNHFNKMGADIVDNDYTTVFQTYNSALERIGKKEIRSVPDEKYLHEARTEPGKYTDGPEDKRRQYFWTKTANENFTYYRLKNVEEYAMAGIRGKHEEVIESSLRVLSIFTWEVLKCYKISNVRKEYIRAILRRQRSIYEEAVSEGYDLDFFAVHELIDIIDRLKDDEIDSIGIGLVSQFCHSTKKSMEFDNYGAFYELARSAKGLSSDYPELTGIIVDTLIESIDVIRENEDEFSEVTEEKIGSWLVSIREWKLEDKELEEKITEAIKERGIETD